MNPAAPGRFATALNCMDGRVQEPVADFVRQHFGVDFVDMVTGAGIVANLHSGALDAVKLSVEAHDSQGIAVVAHANCIGNPIPEAEQKSQCLGAAQLLTQSWPHLDVTPLWVLAEGTVQIIPQN